LVDGLVVPLFDEVGKKLFNLNRWLVTVQTYFHHFRLSRLFWDCRSRRTKPLAAFPQGLAGSCAVRE